MDGSNVTRLETRVKVRHQAKDLVASLLSAKASKNTKNKSGQCSKAQLGLDGDGVCRYDIRK